MKKIFLFCTLICSMAAQAQNCTDESVLNEPGRFLDNHTGKGLRKAEYSPSEIAAANKILQAFENVCKPKLKFTGGQAKASFMLDSKTFYNQSLTSTYTYNLGFHQFVCNVQTHTMKIVDEYQGVLRVTANPSFDKTFPFLDRSNAAYQTPANTKNYNAPYINIFNYYAFGDINLPNAINNGTDFFDLTDEVVGSEGNRILENKPGKGFGYNSGSGFIDVGGFIYRQAYLIHTDIPFFIPVTRKKFLTDVLEYYDREKPLLVASMQDKIKNLKSTIAYSEKNNSRDLQYQKDNLALMEKSAQEIVSVNEQKKQTAQNFLKSKDEKWLSQQAVIEIENKTFTIPYDKKRNMEDVYGKFYFTSFYAGPDGMDLYQINPDYIKKYPPTGAKPSLIKVMFRFKTNDQFTLGVRDTFIKNLDLGEFRKLLK